MGERKPIPEAMMPWYSKVFFVWFTPLVVLARSKGHLDIDDIWKASEAFEVDYLISKFEAQLEKETGGAFPDSWFMMLKCAVKSICYKDLLVSCTLAFIYVLSQLGTSVLVFYLLRSLSEEYDTLYFVLGLVIVIMLTVMSNQISIHINYRCGIRLRGLFVGLIYRQLLKLKYMDVPDANSVTNLVSNDAQKFIEISEVIQFVWLAPVATFLGTFVLYLFIGTSAFVAVSILLLLVPVNYYLGSFLQKIRIQHMPLIDQRVNLTEDVIRNISVVKLFSWDVPFLERILSIRKKEMHFVYREVLAWAQLIFVLILTPALSTLAAFSFHTAQGEPMNASNVFGALTILNWIKFPLMNFSQGFSLGIQLKVALTRIHAFLSLGTTQHSTTQRNGKVADAVDSMNPADGSSMVSVELSKVAEEEKKLARQSSSMSDTGIVVLNGQENSGISEHIRLSGHVSWSKSSDAYVLKDLDVRINKGELVMIIGVVGSGKSTFIASLLNELRVGVASRMPTTAYYCSQIPFVLNATVQSNILFELDGESKVDDVKLQTLYNHVVSLCCLKPDLAEWAYGDQTMLGERGVTLSGGQKCRVSLCRATLGALRDKDAAVLLDDPLSALDMATGRSIFHKVISNQGVLKENTRILVTHNMQYLQEADRVILLHDNQVIFNGAPSELPMDEVQRNEATTPVAKVLIGLCSHVSNFEDSQENQNRKPGVVSDSAKNLNEGNDVDSKLMQVEERVLGENVQWSTFYNYFLAAGGCIFVLAMVTFISLERVFYVLVDFWLATWTQSEQLVNATETTFAGVELVLPADSSDPFYRQVYALLIGILGLVLVGRLSSIAAGFARASNNLFRKMMRSVIDAPISFFESNPLGRIMNRLSYDVEVMDFILVQSMNGAIASAFWLLSALVVMIIVVPVAALGIFPVLCLFLFTQQYYRRCCVELQRIDNRIRSPLMALLEETVAGVLTIRSFKRESLFKRHMFKLVDDTSSAIYSSTTSNRWLGIRVEVLGLLVTVCVTVSAWFFKDTLTPGIIGVALTWCFNCNVSFQFFVIMSTKAEAKLTSAERVIYYGKHLKKELPRAIPDEDVKIPSDWPKFGKVELKNIVLRYRPDFEPALKGISATFNAGEKVGVIGRTGSGKSTLAKALLRLRECESGEILVDGIDIRNVGLNLVRGKKNGIVIIPQDPVVFSGTIRFNLDPFEAFTSVELWESLRYVRLEKVVRDTFGDVGLDGEIKGTFSVGQRQLLCLARALLRTPRILVMDEATASVDAETDDLIQQTVAEAFPTATVIEIAHRLHSVMGADKLLVLNQGTVVEYGAPEELFRNSTEPNGLQSIVAALSEDEQKALTDLMQTVRS